MQIQPPAMASVPIRRVVRVNLRSGRVPYACFRQSISSIWEEMAVPYPCFWQSIWRFCEKFDKKPVKSRD